ncbi:MAG: hypothetical protein NTW66_04365 [Candidatus Magasanikbacteria bacterium]|nr:hypothetical protein [Candidatus Magasanikbacteria bacterium]
MFKAIYKFFHAHYHKRYHGIYRHAKKLFVFDLALLGMAFVMLIASIFFFFWKPSIAGQIDLTFSFGSERIESGDEIHLTINFKNRSKKNLDQAVMGVHMPPGFVIDRIKTPESIFSANSTFNLGKIETGGAGQVEIYGTIYGEPNKEEKVSAFLTYLPDGANAKDQKTGSALFRPAGSVLEAELSMASTSFPGRELPVNIILKNTGSKPLENIFIEPPVGSKFADEKLLKNIYLTPGETKAIAGALTAPDKSGEYTENFEISVMVNNTPIKQVALEKKLAVFYPEMKSGIRLTEQMAFADGGDTLPIRVYWNNSSAYSLKNIRLRITPTPGIVDLKATARANNMTVEGNDLIADKKTRTALTDGSPGSSDEFVINVKLLSFFKTEGQTQLEIKIKAEAELSDVPGQKFVVESGETARLPLSTQISWNIRPVYYTNDGDQLGRGPLPPTVGETTKYWILVEISNGVNAIAENSLKLTLGDGVEFTGKQSVSIGPELKHDQTNNIVSWNYNLAPAGGSIGLNFEVAVTPNSSQVGKKIALIKSAAYSAKDDVVGKSLNLTRGIIDNALTDDDQGSAAKPEVVE